MRNLLVGLIACTFMAAAAVADTTDPQIIAPIQKFVDSFNKGDMAAAAATHATTDDVAIIDEVAPHMWRGSQAVSAWAADLDKDSKANGLSDQMVTLSAPTRVEANGKEAYVVVPAVYSFKAKGAPMKESAQMTFALKKGANGWLIHGWTWTGPKPTAAP